MNQPYKRHFKEGNKTFSITDILDINMEDQDEDRKKFLLDVRRDVEIYPIYDNIDSAPSDISSKFKFFKVIQDDDGELMLILFSQRVKNLIKF